MTNIRILNTRIVNVLMTSTGMGLLVGALFLHLNTHELISLVIGLNLFWFGIIGECRLIKDMRNNDEKM